MAPVRRRPFWEVRPEDEEHLVPVERAIAACRSYEDLDALELRTAPHHQAAPYWPEMWLTFRRGYQRLAASGVVRLLPERCGAPSAADDAWLA